MKSYEELQEENTRLKREMGALQAELDRVMLEFCPNEMTKEQLARWEACQRPADGYDDICFDCR